MGDWSSPIYILSQIFTIFGFGFLAWTYLLKKRPHILVVLIASAVLMSAGHFLLSAWVGVGMGVFGIVRLVIDYFMNSKRSEADKKRLLPIDWAMLFIWSAVYIIVGIITYHGFLSLFSLFASLIFFTSAWQKNVLVYKWLGVVACIFYCVYFAYTENIAGMILEGVLMIFIIIGLVKYINKLKNKQSVSLSNTKVATQGGGGNG